MCGKCYCVRARYHRYLFSIQFRVFVCPIDIFIWQSLVLSQLNTYLISHLFWIIDKPNVGRWAKTSAIHLWQRNKINWLLISKKMLWILAIEIALWTRAPTSGIFSFRTIVFQWPSYAHTHIHSFVWNSSSTFNSIWLEHYSLERFSLCFDISGNVKSLRSFSIQFRFISAKILKYFLGPANFWCARYHLSYNISIIVMYYELHEFGMSPLFSLSLSLSLDIP